eukprot:7255926-Heterocapsa_arctica.AAC.1
MYFIRRGRTIFLSSLDRAPTTREVPPGLVSCLGGQNVEYHMRLCCMWYHLGSSPVTLGLKKDRPAKQVACK